MQLKAEQLGTALRKSLAPIYFIWGDEPLQLGETAGEIRLAARRAGYSDRRVIDFELGTEWHLLASETESLSIFAEKKLIDLRLPSGKPGAEGSKVLTEYCRRPPEDALLLITAGRLEGAAQKSQWYRALEQTGVVVQIRPLHGADLPAWLQRRAERRGVCLQADALKLLVARIEGNLLAAAQEIEKLYILHGCTPINAGMVEAEVADNSRYDVFNLVDTLLLGKRNKAIKILNGLRAEGVAAPIVLWGLSRESRGLANMQAELRQGVSREAVFRKFQIWEKRRPAVQAALTRMSYADFLDIVQICGIADRQIKGRMVGDYWESLFAVCLCFFEKPSVIKKRFYPLFP